MLDVEPPAGLRGRVLDRLDSRATSSVLSTSSVASAFARRIWWLAGPVAAAAVVVAAWAPWRSATEIERPLARSGADTRLAVESAPRPSVVVGGPKPRIAAPRPPAPVQVATARPRTPEPGLIQAADAAGEEVNFTALEALAIPASIAVAPLPGPPPSSIRSIEPAPIQIRALEVDALPGPPRERREE